MTNEEKQLLLKDLCGRILYTPYVLLNGKKRCLLTGIDEGKVYLNVDSEPFDLSESNIKPYLRPMSSMTGKEIVDCYWLQQGAFHVDFYRYDEGYEKSIDLTYFGLLVDFYHSHHLDYLGLIDKGLALEAPEDMYKTE